MLSRLHPSELSLSEFLLGKAAEPDHSSLEQHLAECGECQNRAAALHPADTFVVLLASAHTRSDQTSASVATPAPAALSTPTLTWVAGEQAPNLRTNLPPVLANHPKYRPIRLIGCGGMGSVWLAQHVVMNREVAVKVIRPDQHGRPQAMSRFTREIRATAKLDDRNIVRALDAEEVDGACLLVMEYVPGESLADIVGRGELPIAEACRAARDAALGLAHAHAAGIVHRDVKPSNLIRTPDGVTKILDFGLVTSGADAPSPLSGENMVIGTPDYIAPEQIAEAHAADARSDIYSLGCTLYHLLSGRVPYPSGSVIQKLDDHRSPVVQPAPLTNVPPELAAVVNRMLAKNPADRFQTALEAAAALEPFLSGPAPKSDLDSRRRSSNRYMIAAGVLIAAIGLLTVGVAYKIQRDNEVITVTTDDPDIEVEMKRNGELIRIVDTKTKHAWELDAKKLRLKPDGGELTIDLPEKGPLVIRRDGKTAVTIRWEAVTVEPRAGKPSPPGPLSVTDFRELHAANVTELRKWCDKIPVGFYPANITARGATKTPLFDAVAIRDDRHVKFEVHFELGNHNKQSDVDAMHRAGWALKSACTYLVDGKVLRHHVWIPHDGKGWLADGIQLGGLPEAMERWKREAWRPKNFWLNDLETGKGQPTRPLGVLLESDQGVLWQFHAELSANELVVELATARKQGRRPDALGALGDGKDRTYSLSLVPNPDNLGWEFQTNLSTDQFETSMAEQKKLNRRPLVILSEGEDVATKYTAVWIEYARTN